MAALRIVPRGASRSVRAPEWSTRAVELLPSRLEMPLRATNIIFPATNMPLRAVELLPSRLEMPLHATNTIFPATNMPLRARESSTLVTHMPSPATKLMLRPSSTAGLGGLGRPRWAALTPERSRYGRPPWSPGPGVVTAHPDHAIARNETSDTGEMRVRALQRGRPREGAPPCVHRQDRCLATVGAGGARRPPRQPERGGEAAEKAPLVLIREPIRQKIRQAHATVGPSPRDEVGERGSMRRRGRAYRSILVRSWEAGAGRRRFVVEAVSGEPWRWGCDSLEELLDFLRAELTRSEGPPAAAPPPEEG